MFSSRTLKLGWKIFLVSVNALFYPLHRYHNISVDMIINQSVHTVLLHCLLWCCSSPLSHPLLERKVFYLSRSFPHLSLSAESFIERCSSLCVSFLLHSHISIQMRVDSPVKTLIIIFYRSACSYTVENSTLNCSPFLFSLYTLYYTQTQVL